MYHAKHLGLLPSVRILVDRMAQGLCSKGNKHMATLSISQQQLELEKVDETKVTNM